MLGKRTRHWIEVLTALALVGAVVGTWWYLHYRTDHTTTAISIEDVLRDYRSASQPPPPPASAAPTTAAPTAPAPTVAPPEPVPPTPGVYRYTTTGSDGVDALGGASHTYPARSTITVTADRCTTQRWTAAEERWDETTTCVTGGGVQLQRFVAFHRFFGADDTETSTCDGDPRPLGAPAGTSWTARCMDGDETQTWTGTVVGQETAVVGGRTVAVEHVVVTIDDGDARDSQRTETWYLAGSDLVVRRVSDVATTEGSPVGDVHYVEHYEMSLDSLSPLG